MRVTWADVPSIIEEKLPQLRENARLTLELERAMIKAGIPVRPRPPILTQLYIVLGLLGAEEQDK